MLVTDYGTFHNTTTYQVKGPSAKLNTPTVPLPSRALLCIRHITCYGKFHNDLKGPSVIKLAHFAHCYGAERFAFVRQRSISYDDDDDDDDNDDDYDDNDDTHDRKCDELYIHVFMNYIPHLLQRIFIVGSLKLQMSS